MNRIISCVPCGRRIYPLISLCMCVLGIASAQITEIPFTLNNGLIIIEVAIESRKYKFMIDSGTSETVISPKVADRLGFRWRSHQRVKDSNGRRARVERLRLRLVEIGSQSYRNRYARIIDLDDRQGLGTLGVQGIIGLDILQQHQWEIDGQRSRIRLYPRQTRRMVPGRTLPMSWTDDGRPQLAINLGSHRVIPCLFDLGYNGEIELDLQDLETIASQQNLLLMRGHTSGSTGLLGKGKPEPLVLVHVPHIQIGTIVLPAVLARGRQAVRPKVGARLFQGRCLTIDWERDQIHLK